MKEAPQGAFPISVRDQPVRLELGFEENITTQQKQSQKNKLRSKMRLDVE